jgi:hypothetical protein
MDHRFFYCGLILLIVLIFVAPGHNIQIGAMAIGAGGLNTQDARFPPGNNMSADLNDLFRQKWGVTAF